MKKIVLACGAGVATSAVVAQKISALLDANGYADSYEIVQCPVGEAKDTCTDADLLKGLASGKPPPASFLLRECAGYGMMNRAFDEGRKTRAWRNWQTRMVQVHMGATP